MEEKTTWWPCKHVSTCLKPKNNFEYHDKKISWKRKLVLRPRAKRTTRSKMGQYFNEVEFHSCTMVISGYQKYCSTHQHHIGHMNQKILRPTTFHCPQTFFYVLKIFGDLSIDNWVPHSGMLLYLHLRDYKIFFHPAKFDNLKAEKISDFKTVSVSQSKNLLDWKLVV